MNSRKPLLFVPLAFVLMALVYACTTPQPAGTTGETSIVQIDRDTHFLTPDGEDVVVFPGAYLVQSEKNGLRLIAEEGTGSESVVIAASDQTHQQKLTGPTVLAISEKEDEQVVALLMPDGKGWEAMGSHSGVVSRAAPRHRTPQSQLQQAIALRNQLLVQFQQLSLIRASAQYQALNETYQGTLAQNTWRLPVSDTLDNGLFNFSWAAYEAGQSLQKLPRLNTIPELSDLVSKQQCCVQLLVGGRPMKGVTINFGRDGNLITRVSMPFSKAKTWPKTVKLVITQGTKKWESADTKIYANPVSYYAKVLHPIFSHDRCVTCHTLGDRQAIVAMHESRLGAGNYPDVEDAKPHNPDFCGGCHTISPGSDHTDLNLNNEWFSPAAVQGINWQGKNASQVCSIVTGPFTNKDGVTGTPFDAQTFHHHFHDDPRILWAVSSGWVPFGRPDLPVPIKNNLQGWFAKVDPWVGAGTPCPQQIFFRLPGKIQPGQLVPQGR